MEPDKLGPVLRPIFKNTKALFKNIVQGEVVLSFRKGPAGKVDKLKSIIWDKAFGCQVKIDNVTDNGLFILIEKNGGIFLSGKLLVLPQSNIEELIKKGEVNDSILDAQKEIFNMLVGKIGDILIEKVEKGVHLVMGENFIVNEKDISFLPPDQKYISYTANVKIAGPITFSMAVIMSTELADFILKHIEADKEMEDEKNGKPTSEEDSIEDEKDEESEKGDKMLNKGAFNTSQVSQTNGDFCIEEIMEEDFPVAQIGTSLWGALNKMREYGSDFIILVDGLKFIGLLTMADIRRGLSPFIEDPFKEYCREQDLATKSFNVEWFLQKDVIPVRYDASLEQIVQTYLGQDMPYIPVCKNTRIVGVITHKKLIGFLASILFEKISTDDELRTKLVTNALS